MPLGNQTDLTLDHGNLPTNKESDPLECNEQTNEQMDGPRTERKKSHITRNNNARLIPD